MINNNFDDALLEWRDGGEFVETAKGRLFVRSRGEGPALLMVHGFPTSSWDWHALAPLLESSFQVITIDMLGYGFSDKPTELEYSTALQVELIHEVLSKKSINSMHVMSYSYGVSVVQEMLSLQQQGVFSTKIESLCFMNGGLFPDSNHPKLSQKLLLGPLGFIFVQLMNKRSLEKNMSAIFGPRTQPSKKLINQYWDLINVNQGRGCLPRLIQYLHERKFHMHRWEASLRNEERPIQLIIGDQDAISGLEVANEFRQKISEKNVHVLEQIGHYPQIEAPAKVEALYREFIASL